MNGYEIGIFILVIFVAWIWIYWQKSEALLKKYGASTHFRIGTYLVGLENCNYLTKNVECVVAPDYFVFAKLSGRELGRVPRNSIEEVAFDDKSQITQRLTATRMIALGVFALAAPKKKKISEWCVAIRWVDGNTMKRTTVFEFTGSNPEGDANRAANMLLKNIDGRRQQPSVVSPLAAVATADTKACPFCAETIKAAAIVCRFCNHELPR